MAVAMVALPVSPASAGTCTTPFCGGTVNNNATSSIAVTNCWGSGAYYYGENHSCMTNGWSATKYNAGVLIGPTDSSSGYYHYYDVDGFRVLHGCKAVVRYNGGGAEITYDRRGYAGSMWVRITGTNQATILSYTC